MVLFFPMLPQWLPPGHSVQSPPRSGNFSAQTSASFHSSRSAAPAPLSLCCTGSLTLCCIGAPAGQQPHGCLKFCAVPAPPAGNTSWAPQALRCTGAPCRQQTSSGGEKYSGLASNLAHLGRICKLAAAVCGISQHLLTYMRPSPLLPRRTAAQTDANLPAHLHRLPTPPPYLRQMRL